MVQDPLETTCSAIPAICMMVGIVAVLWALVLSSQKSRRAAEEAAKNNTAAMEPYLLYYEQVRPLGDPDRLVDAGRKLTEAAWRWAPQERAVIAWNVYQDALKLLAERSDLRPHVLSMGRRAYGWRRPDNMPSVYDETAIGNDIAAATPQM